MTSSRYYELDWLRIILILGVFLHHSLMPFNGDDWHIMNADSSGLLDDMMVYFEQFRLPALFFIAGAGALLLLNKRKPVAFMKDKVMRLLLPLLVGVIFIVPPQSYIENMTDYSSYVSAYLQLLVNFDANHLWFIEFLFVFMLLAIPIYQLFNKILISEEVQNRIVFFNNAFYVLFIGVLIGLSRVVLRLYYPEDDHSIFNPAVSLFYLMFFVLGMVFISNPQYWKSLEINRRFNLYILIIISILFYAYYWLDFSPYFSLQTRWSIWWFLGALLSLSLIHI